MAYVPRKFKNHPNTLRFKEACKAWASMLDVSPSVIFKVAGNKRKKSPYWSKDRYYGGTLATDADIAWMRVNAIENEVSSDIAAAVIKLSSCVKDMCYSCTRSSPKAAVKPVCPDGSCPLRPVSPLQLAKKTR